MLESIALKGARWVLRRGRGSNALSLSDTPHLGLPIRHLRGQDTVNWLVQQILMWLRLRSFFPY
jgi:hypothetical protein